MRGIAGLLPVKYKFKQVYPVAGSWGTVATLTPKKQETRDSAEGTRVSNEKSEPIVAFSRPPPLPPLLGPLVVLSLYSSHVNGDDA